MKIIAWCLVFIVALAVLIGGTLGIRYLTAPVKGIVQEREIINSGNNRIYQYEDFFNQCAAIQGYEQAILAQKDLLLTAEKEDKSRINTNIAAISAQRARAIAQYNVDAAKYTKNKYFDGQLPVHINLQGNTQCAN